MEEVFKERKIETVMDVGCGSGVLAVCAAVLGADMVLALDFDSVAVKETKENAWRNGVASKIHLLQGSLESVKGRFELVMANITTSELLKMREELKNKLKGGGVLLISGISEIKKNEAIYGFKEVGFSLKKEIFCEGWVGLIFAL